MPEYICATLNYIDAHTKYQVYKGQEYQAPRTKKEARYITHQFIL